VGKTHPSWEFRDGPWRRTGRRPEEHHEAPPAPGGRPDPSVFGPGVNKYGERWSHAEQRLASDGRFWTTNRPPTAVLADWSRTLRHMAGDTALREAQHTNQQSLILPVPAIASIVFLPINPTGDLRMAGPLLARAPRACRTARPHDRQMSLEIPGDPFFAPTSSSLPRPREGVYSQYQDRLTDQLRRQPRSCRVRVLPPHSSSCPPVRRSRRCLGN